MAATEPPTYRRIYTPAEVAVHNAKEDCWIVVHRKVFNLTKLLENDYGSLSDPILDNAGTDVSHWFDKSTNDVLMHVDEETGLTIPYTPQGRFIHVPPRDPTSAWKRDFDVPWWQDAQYVIGAVTEKTRKVRVLNTLTHHEHVVEVGAEETIAEIGSRFLAYNAHASSYTWKALKDGAFTPLDMDMTLGENGVVDEDDEFEALYMDPDAYLPTLHLYYNDDLTSA